MSRYITTNNLLNIMDSFFDDYSPVSSFISRNSSTPSLNVSEMNDKYEITLAIPGIDANKVKIQLTGKNLSVSYDHEESEEIGRAHV